MHGAVLAMSEMSVGLSVRLSNACFMTKYKKRMPFAIFIPHKKTFYLVVFRRRMVSGGHPLLPDILGQTGPVGAKTPIFNPYSLVAPQS